MVVYVTQHLPMSSPITYPYHHPSPTHDDLPMTYDLPIMTYLSPTHDLPMTYLSPTHLPITYPFITNRLYPWPTYPLPTHHLSPTHVIAHHLHTHHDIMTYPCPWPTHDRSWRGFLSVRSETFIFGVDGVHTWNKIFIEQGLKITKCNGHNFNFKTRQR